MIPVFLEILITDVFSIYTILSGFEDGSITIKHVFVAIIWNVYITVPIFTMIFLGSKTTEKAQLMNPIIGKLINRCDDHKILERVNYIVRLCNTYPNSHSYSYFSVETIFNSITKS